MVLKLLIFFADMSLGLSRIENALLILLQVIVIDRLIVAIRDNSKNSSLTKLVRLRFCQLQVEQELAIRDFIVKYTDAQKAIADKHFEPGSPDEKRKNIRVFFNNQSIEVQVQIPADNDSQKFEGELTDLSLGGCCIRVAESVKLTKQSTAKIFIDAIIPGLSAQAEILGLQYDD